MPEVAPRRSRVTRHDRRGMRVTGSEDAARQQLRTRVVTAAITIAVVILLAVVLTRVVGDDDDPSAAERSTPSDMAPSASPEPTDATPRDAPAPGESGTGGAGAPAEGGDADGDGQAVDSRRAVRVPLDAVATPEPGLRIRVTRVEEVRSRAEIPGETSRPALRITVRAENTTDEPVAIGGALTNLYYGPARNAASLVLRPGGRPFPQDVAPGASASSVVVYNVPPEARGDIVLEVSLDATIRRVEFSGDCADDC